MRKKITKSEVQATIRIIVPGILLILFCKVIADFIHELAFNISFKYFDTFIGWLAYDITVNSPGLSYVIFWIGLFITVIGVVTAASEDYR